MKRLQKKYGEQHSSFLPSPIVHFCSDLLLKFLICLAITFGFFYCWLAHSWRIHVLISSVKDLAKISWLLVCPPVNPWKGFLAVLSVALQRLGWSRLSSGRSLMASL